MISAVYGAVSLVAAIDTLMGGLMSSEAFMMGFRWACVLPLRLYPLSSKAV